MFNLFKKKKKTGLIPGQKDKKDYEYITTGTFIKPEGVDLRERFPLASYQNGYNSCAAHTTCALVDYFLKYKKKYTSWDLDTSEAFVWYYGRKRLGTQNKNSGMILRDAFKVINTYGFIPNKYWDYKDGIYDEPNQTALMAGEAFKNFLNQIPKYYLITNTDHVIDALNNESPVAFGMPTDSNYQFLKKPGIIKSVKPGSSYHAQLITGYKFIDEELYFIVRNSWGTTWGDKGHSYIHRSILDDHGFDMWTLG
jgi:hypothetical protein